MVEPKEYHEMKQRITDLETALWFCRDGAEDILERGYRESMHAEYIIEEVNHALKDREE